VELALVEANCEARFDATRCLERPLLTLVTSVEEDTRFSLGQGQAAWEQAGLARPGVPLLTTERKSQVLAAFAQRCREVGAALVLLDPQELEPVELTWQRAVWRSLPDPLGLGVFETRFLGAYQQANLALALGALAELVGGMPLGKEAIREGLASAHRPGRFEVVSLQPYVVLDGAQNPAGARALVDSLNRLPRPGGRRTLVFSARRDKLIRDTAGVLFPEFERVVLATPDCEGALPAEAVAPQAARLGVPWELGGELAEAVREAVRGLEDEDLLVVCGPLPALEEARGVT
jgi:dihydrofolate synthase/folylpolyglutamate synthase